MKFQGKFRYKGPLQQDNRWQQTNHNLKSKDHLLMLGRMEAEEGNAISLKSKSTSSIGSSEYSFYSFVK
jgi:hypothetical protein